VKDKDEEIERLELSRNGGYEFGYTGKVIPKGRQVNVDLSDQLREKDANINDLSDQLREKEETIEIMEGWLKAKEEELDRSKYIDQVKRIEILQKVCDDKDKKIARLEQRIGFVADPGRWTAFVRLTKVVLTNEEVWNN
jgi:hypothetical protein